MLARTMTKPGNQCPTYCTSTKTQCEEGMVRGPKLSRNRLAVI